ncbi:OFA family MFS transporter [Cellulomonas sp. KRMCY2]|uniref:OFA family MFS transporter n=1 Tax=Cellulomonas sp. KRMCY2 TaxID=1304865 RepID=UPI0004A2A212|nr:OFA family MFS transporter [Cellulomonas sp. KRMCY2]
MNLLDRSRTIAPPGFNRWLVPPAALAVHLSIGQVYSFSVLKDPLIQKFFPETGVGTPIAVIFSIAIVMLGLSAAFGGVWMERNGPRKAMVLSAFFWVTGFLVAALGVHLGQLWLVYLGYGVIGGMGLGIGYISPVSTLIKWFPDRPGLATGLAIMGFGGGALVAAPLTQKLLDSYGADPVDALVPTLLTLAAIYGVLMAAGATVIRLPAPGWAPAGWVPSIKKGSMQTHADVRVRNAVRTPQFYLLWIVLFVNVTAGIGILEDAKPMIQDFFPNTVTEATATGFVGLLSLANMGGRFGWSTLSDRIGRKQAYAMYLGVGAMLYTLLAVAGDTATALFVTVTFFIVSFYGGGFATIPAYLKDLFGKLEVGAIHGRLLTAWSAAGVAGPLIVNTMVDGRREAGLDGSALYIPSMVVMACLLLVGFVANMLVKPVHEDHHEPDAGATIATPAEALVLVGTATKES